MCVSGLSIRPFLGVSLYVGEAVKAYGTNGRRKRNAVGVTPWGVIDNHSDLIGRDVSVVLCKDISAFKESFKLIHAVTL